MMLSEIPESRNDGAATAPSFRKYEGLLLGIAVFTVPFAAFTIFILFHFYVRGSFLLDAGWMAYLLSHGGALLPLPKAYGAETYYTQHISPIFTVIALLRRALPVSDIQFFAGFMGVCHALPGLAVFWALYPEHRRRGLPSVAAAVLLAWAFAFNGIALAMVRYPHAEILIAGSIMLFAVALVRGRLGAAAILFVVALTTREDAGFHLCGLLAVLIGISVLRGVPWRVQRAALAFAAVGLAYGLAALIVQRALWGGSTTLAITYLGAPPFAHITLAHIGLRLTFWGVYRAYVVVPAAIAVVWAVKARNPHVAAGYIAFLPWAVLQLVAYSDIAGTLSGYYAYPFMIAAFWPLISRMVERPRTGNGTEPRLSIMVFATMLASSFIGLQGQYNPGQLDLAQALVSPPSLARQRRTDTAIAELVRAEPVLGRIVADTSVVAIAPDDFAPSETVTGTGPAPPSTVIYFAHGYEADAAHHIATAAGLTRHYRVPGTSLRLATAPTVDPPPALAALLTPADAAE